MFTVDITPEQFEHIRQKLRRNLLQSPDPDISLLLQQLEKSCDPSRITQAKGYSFSPSYNAPQSKKRAMPDTEDTIRESAYP
jgi:hypothetical protein